MAPGAFDAVAETLLVARCKFGSSWRTRASSSKSCTQIMTATILLTAHTAVSHFVSISSCICALDLLCD